MNEIRPYSVRNCRLSYEVVVQKIENRIWIINKLSLYLVKRISRHYLPWSFLASDIDSSCGAEDPLFSIVLETSLYHESNRRSKSRSDQLKASTSEKTEFGYTVISPYRTALVTVLRPYYY